MAQSGQYNFLRCLDHGEKEAAQLACNEFVGAALKSVFLLKGKYLPYYKWQFRALRELLPSSSIADSLSFILTSGCDEDSVSKKADLIEDVSDKIVKELIEKSLTKAVCGDLEKHAYSVNDLISDGNIRNLNILAAV